MRVEWTEPALADLAALRDYIAEDSPANAERFIERLFEAAARLVAHPRLGREVPEADEAPEEIRELIFRDYRILYLVETDTVQVLTVIHGSREIARMAKKPWE
ncbi:MAG TPA: type II toxin-antitoxin system RelE/ParE family toxin [Nevskiales bacterium]|nr:type II toxin-antitoxin system RelE/ParE family toxin [Nevskiales bacterium]